MNGQHNNFIHGLIDRWLKGTSTPQEQEQLQQYFIQYDLTEEQLGNEPDLHPRKDQSERMYARLTEQLFISQPEIKTHSLQRKWLLRMAAAIIPLAIITAGAYYLLKGPQNTGLIASAQKQITNTTKGILHLTLTDGTGVWLNEHASIQLDTSNFNLQRNITFNGEAYFDIASDEKHPFTVTAGDLRTTVLGTTFAIRMDTALAHTTVTLFTGKVSLDANKTPARLLNPGEDATYNTLSGQLKIAPASVYAIAWMTKEIVCKNEPLENIIRYLQEYYGLKINMNKNIAGNQFSGTLSLKGNISTVLDRLLFVHQLHYKKNENSITIY